MNLTQKIVLTLGMIILMLGTGCASTKRDANYAAYLAAQQATEASKAQRPLFILEGIEGQQIELKGIKKLAVYMPDTGTSNVALPPQAPRPWYAEVIGTVINGAVAYKTGQAMWNTVGALGSSIERAGTHGYQFVQAPGAVTNTATTTTTTNTSTVTTSNSNNTTRNGAGGNGAAGGTATGTTGATTAGQGAAGGAASC